MDVSLLAFAQARDLFGFSERSISCDVSDTARQVIARYYPNVNLVTLRVAVDCEFRDWDEPLGDAKEIAIIPPVSGG